MLLHESPSTTTSRCSTTGDGKTTGGLVSGMTMPLSATFQLSPLADNCGG
jgi:hypothetical protein